MLDESFLPAVIRMTEENTDTKQASKSLVIFEENIVVGRARLHFGKALFDMEKRRFKIFDRHRQYLLNEWDAKLPIDDREQNTASRFSRDDEIELDIADPLPLIDISRSPVDESPA